MQLKLAIRIPDSSAI